MVKALFDTNILIDFLNGIAAAKAELELYEEKAISAITWMEVQVGTTPQDQAAVDRFLARFTLLPIDERVARRAVVLRKEKHVKLPDAIIWATAQVDSRLFVTRNSKDFAISNPGVRHPYAV